MTITLSVALLLGAVVIVLCKWAGLRIWHAAVCIFCGFYLASSSIAPYISQFMSNLLRLL